MCYYHSDNFELLHSPVFQFACHSFLGVFYNIFENPHNPNYFRLWIPFLLVLFMNLLSFCWYHDVDVLLSFFLKFHPFSFSLTSFPINISLSWFTAWRRPLHSCRSWTNLSSSHFFWGLDIKIRCAHLLDSSLVSQSTHWHFRSAIPSTMSEALVILRISSLRNLGIFQAREYSSFHFTVIVLYFFWKVHCNQTIWCHI